jgi:hypothetical protein
MLYSLTIASSLFNALVTIARGGQLLSLPSIASALLFHTSPIIHKFYTNIPARDFFFVFFNFFDVTILAIIHKRIQPYLATDKI